MRGASFPSRRLREKRRNDGERWLEGNRCDSPAHAIEPVLLSSNHLFIVQQISILLLLSFSTVFPFTPCNNRSSISVEIFLNSFNFELNLKECNSSFNSRESLPFQIPKSFSSPFRDRPSFPSIHPSTISSFPICHARCVVSFSSPIATLVDRRAGHERRRSQVEEEEKGDGGKRDEMWSAMGTHEGRNGTCWTSRCHWPEPAPASRKRDEKEEKGESWERWGVKCNRKRYLRRVWFFHHTGLLYT